MITINKFKQFFTITSDMFDKLIFDLFLFNKNLKTFKRPSKRSRNQKVQVDKEFFVIDYRNNVIRYPITVLGDMLTTLQTLYPNEEIKIDDVKPVIGKNIEIETTHGFELRDYQKTYKESMLKNFKDKHTTIVNLRTGGGKSILALEMLAEIKKRFLILVLPMYIEKWIGDVTSNTNIKPEEIYVIRGSDSLRKLFELPKEEKDKIKCYIASMSTISKYIREWLNVDEIFSFSVSPDKIAEELDFSVVLNDESHLEFHNVFRFMLFANVNFLLGLTATLDTNDYRLKKMHALLFPEEHRLQNLVDKRYINVISIKYHFRNPKRIRFDRGFGYNQATFEQSIIRNSDMLERYLKMIFDIYLAGYAKYKTDVDKLLIFAGTIEMCTLIRDYFKDRVKDLNIIKYNSGEDEYSSIETADIIVSTINSLGTAVDIKNLRAVIQTVAIDSPAANKQSIGRLRDLKDRDVYFYYLWSGDIKSHRRYNYNRIKYFKDIAKDVKFVVYKNNI